MHIMCTELSPELSLKVFINYFKLVIGDISKVFSKIFYYSGVFLFSYHEDHHLNADLRTISVVFNTIGKPILKY